MSEQEIRPNGPKEFEPCHVCGHQPQHEQFMAKGHFPGDGEKLFHRYLCTHCNEGTDRHDDKGYAGLEWNGKQLKAKKKASPELSDAYIATLIKRIAEYNEKFGRAFQKALDETPPLTFVEPAP